MRISKETIKNSKGITLIALVITIIILLILSGITIATLTGENGIITKAQQAARETEIAQIIEKARLDIIEVQADNEGIITQDQLDEIYAKYGTVSGEGADQIITTEKGYEIKTSDIWSNGGDTTMSVTEAKESGEEFVDTTTIKDGNENEVTIPGGFKVAADSGDTVQQGIVIEDVSASGDSNVQGSQFVWIPVGEAIKDNGDATNITLGRYEFDTTNGTPLLKQDAKDYEDETAYGFGESWNCIEYNTYREGVISEKLDGLNATAKDLKSFVEKTQSYGGYYLARYEASYASGSSTVDYKCASKVSTGYSKSSMNYTSGTLWNRITQADASKVAINTYADSSNVKSDLVNSYGWDTAIVYIQEMGNSNYANANIDTTGNTSLLNTGTTGDEKCKIFDMAGNPVEWTTEYSTFVAPHHIFDYDVAYSCVGRGGEFDYPDYTTSKRSHIRTTGPGAYNSFRILLYVE